MSASKLGARFLTVLATAAVGFASGCYATTPHTAHVASSAEPRSCTSAIADVFSRAGFVQLATPPNVSMFFSPQLTGPYSSFLRSGTGVGVNIDSESAGAGVCNVTLEALSPDVNCPEMHEPLSCGGGGGMDEVTGMRTWLGTGNASGSPPCPIVRTPTCKLSYAPGEDNDAAVDELARRVQVALGGEGHVTRTP
jgi:hypothetical protein